MALIVLALPPLLRWQGNNASVTRAMTLAQQRKYARLKGVTAPVQ